MAFALPRVLRGKDFDPLPSVPIQIPPIPIHIPILAPQLSALMPRRCIVSIIQIAAKLTPVMSDLGLIMSNIPPVAPSILGKHRSRAQSHQQKHSRNRSFHIVTSSASCGFCECKPASGCGVARQRSVLAVQSGQPLPCAVHPRSVNLRQRGRVDAFQIAQLPNHPTTQFLF